MVDFTGKLTRKVCITLCKSHLLSILHYDGEMVLSVGKICATTEKNRCKYGSDRDLKWSIFDVVFLCLLLYNIMLLKFKILSLH